MVLKEETEKYLCTFWTLLNIVVKRYGSKTIENIYIVVTFPSYIKKWIKNTKKKIKKCKKKIKKKNNKPILSKGTTNFWQNV